MADIPYEDLPPFLQMMEDWERERANPSFNRNAARPPVIDRPPEAPPAAPSSARPVAEVRTVPTAPPRPAPRRPVRMSSAAPSKPSQGRLL